MMLADMLHVSKYLNTGGYRERVMSATRSRAPEFPAGLEWFNVKDPVRLDDQAGRIVLMDFGTFSSIHCQHVLQDIKSLLRRFRKKVTRERILSDVKKKRFFVKKSEERRRAHRKAVRKEQQRLRRERRRRY